MYVRTYTTDSMSYEKSGEKLVCMAISRNVSKKNTDSTNLHPPTRGPVKSRDAELTNISIIWGRVEADLLKIFLKSQVDQIEEPYLIVIERRSFKVSRIAAVI